MTLHLPTQHVVVAVLLDSKLGLYGMPLLTHAQRYTPEMIQTSRIDCHVRGDTRWDLCNLMHDAYDTASATLTNMSRTVLTPPEAQLAPNAATIITAGGLLFALPSISMKPVDIAIVLGAPPQGSLNHLCTQFDIQFTTPQHREVNKIVNARRLASKKARFQRHTNPHRPVPQPDQLVYCDLAGPFPSSIASNRHMLVISEAAYHFPVAYPQPTKSSLSTVNSVRHYFTNYNDMVIETTAAPTGVCMSSDNGTEFRGKVSEYNYNHTLCGTMRHNKLL